MDYREMGCGFVNWIKEAQDGIQWWDLFSLLKMSSLSL
jgi:hypothetical protein